MDALSDNNNKDAEDADESDWTSVTSGGDESEPEFWIFNTSKMNEEALNQKN